MTSSALKVLLVCDDYPSAFAGGVATSVMNLAKGLAQLGHEVVLVWPEEPRAYPIPGVRQVKVQGWRVQLGKNHIVFARPPNARDLPEHWTPDIVHAHQPTPLTWWARWYSRTRGLPLVVTMHNLLEHAHDPVGRWLLALIYRATLRAADLTITPAEFSTRYAIARFGLTRTATRSNSVDLAQYAREDDVPQEPRAVPELIAAISLVPYKNPMYLIELVAALRDRGVTVNLSIAGKGALREDMETRARALGLEGRISFLGTVPHAQLLERMRQSDALLLTSRVELQPMVVLEAKLFGTPAFIADSPLSGASALIEEGVTGATFALDDAPRAAQQLEPYLRDPARLRAMRAATASSAAQYDLEPVAERMVEAYWIAMERQN
jgi:glycosyltransferase involved in cell wall biosynthesis